MPVIARRSRSKKNVSEKPHATDSTMEWMMMNMDRFFAPSIQLGGYVADDKYMPAPNCRAKLEEILHRLNQDKARWHFRRSLFMSKIISKHLLPMLIHIKDDRGLMESIVKVLQELMTPVECLMPVEIMGQNYEGRHIIHELECAIVLTKKLFLNTKVTKALVVLMASVLQDSKGLTLAECEMVNHCLLLVRNLLHVSNIPCPHLNKNPPTSTASSNQQVTSSNTQVLTEDQIMWNLFAQRFDNVIIQLLTCDQQHLWNVTLVQLVSLMYREQQQSTIRKLIHEWLDSSPSESSEDDENNTMSSSSSDAISTFDPVSDSSERLSPVDSVNKDNSQNNNQGNENSDNSRTTKTDKEDSCKDSGFGRSGSNMDSSPEESVSESTSHLTKPWDPSSNTEDKKYKKQVQALKITDTSEVVMVMQEEKETVENTNPMETCEIETGKDNMCDIKVELIERENEQGDSGGSEGGSEGSTPVEPIEQVSSPFIEEIEDVAEVNDGNQQKSSQDTVKRPPNKEESGSSGDSSEKKPPPQLPKTLKNKPSTGQKRSRHTMSQKMLSESQENNESSNSNDSECDEGPHAKRPHHQKPHKMLSKPRPAKMLQKALQERNVKRSKLMKRKEANSIKTKALLHHHPSPEDISNLLKEFTVDFMLNGYSNMVQGLRLQVMLPYQIDLDKSHLLWLITYFLRFAVELDLELYQICPVLSVDVVSYLVYEGVVMQEELEQAVRAGEENLLPHVRRLHLVVTALREFFVAFDVCLKREQNLCNPGRLFEIKEELGQLVEVRQLFVLLIRMYRPGVLNLNYLQDLITTNHRFLTTQEQSITKISPQNTFSVVDHIKQFATTDIMRQYGRLLENFNINDETVNDCIFTMMHHIAGDLRNVNVLLQPFILKVFLRIWKEGFELCSDWADLIEYVLRKCTKVRTDQPNKDSKNVQKPKSEAPGIELTDEDLDQLYSHYTASSSEQDLMDKIKEICCDDSIEEPIKKEVIQKLLARGFITTSECSKLCAEIPPIVPRITKSEVALSLECDVMQVSSDSEESMDALPSTSIHELHHRDRKLSVKSRSSEETIVNLKNKKKQTDDIILEEKNNSDNKDVQNAVPKTEECAESNMTCTEDSTDWDDNSTITFLIEHVKEEGYGAQIQWLQLQLLEACYSKLKMVGPNLPKAEPVPCHFTLSNQSIPLIPWTNEQEEAFSSPKFCQLLGELGFHLPSDTGKIFPRIPHFWCSEVLFMVAKRLGPISSSSLRVSVEWMQDIMQQMRAMSLTGALGTLCTQDEDTEAFKDTSSFDCDDSSERVSDCSMENNRSGPSSPVSSIDENLVSLHNNMEEVL